MEDNNDKIENSSYLFQIKMNMLIKKDDKYYLLSIASNKSRDFAIILVQQSSYVYCKKYDIEDFKQINFFKYHNFGMRECIDIMINLFQEKKDKITLDEEENIKIKLTLDIEIGVSGIDLSIGKETIEFTLINDYDDQMIKNTLIWFSVLFLFQEKENCKKLNSTEIQKEIIKRNENQYKNNKEKYKIILKEKEIKDPEPEINYEDLERNDEPIFENNNLNNNIEKIIEENGAKPKKKKNKNKKNNNNGIKEIIKVKVSNLDENMPLNEINKYFNRCKCSGRQFYNGYSFGFLEFSNINSANDCIVNCNGEKLGNKKISLKIVDDDEY
jgi:hypothetical protein